MNGSKFLWIYAALAMKQSNHSLVQGGKNPFFKRLIKKIAIQQTILTT